MKKDANSRLIRLSRRELIRVSAVAGLGLAGLDLLAACGQPAPAPTAVPTKAPVAAPTQAAPAATQAPAPTQAAAKPAVAAAKKGGTLKIGTAQTITSVDPHKVALANDWNVLAGPFNSLVRLNAKMEPVPELATAWEIADPVTYVFKLRKGVKFHNGREMTADDVKFSFDRVVNPDTGSRFRGQSFPEVKSIEVVDPYTVKIVNGNPFAPQLDALGNVKIVAKESVPDIARKPIGTGPYMIAEFVPEDHVTFKKFADYWDKDNQHLDGAVLTTTKDATSLLQAFRSGQFDLLWSLPPAEIDGMQKGKDWFLLEPEVGGIVQQMMVDNDAAPFKDLNARLALSYAMDRETINTVANFGKYVRQDFDVPFPQGRHWAYNPNLKKSYPFDLKKAKELFNAAGVNESTPLTFVAITTANPHWVVAGEVVQRTLTQIGIKMEIKKYDLPGWQATFQPATEKTWPWTIITTGTGLTEFDPAFNMAGFTSPARSLTNYRHWARPWADELIQKGRRAVDREERKKAYFELQEKMTEDPPGPFVYVHILSHGAWKHVKNVYVEPGGMIHWETTWLDK